MKHVLLPYKNAPLSRDCPPLPAALVESRSKPRASPSAITAATGLPMSISRTSRGRAASEKRYQKAFLKINALSMIS
jgi:hypothetical protein